MKSCEKKGQRPSWRKELNKVIAIKLPDIISFVLIDRRERRNSSENIYINKQFYFSYTNIFYMDDAHTVCVKIVRIWTVKFFSVFCVYQRERMRIIISIFLFSAQNCLEIAVRGKGPCRICTNTITYILYRTIVQFMAQFLENNAQDAYIYIEQTNLFVGKQVSLLRKLMLGRYGIF